MRAPASLEGPLTPLRGSSVAPQGGAFEILDDLPGPQDTVLLEASAGTGKTWTIGALVARYVAEGMPLESLLVITFGRAASQEMRERVREHLRMVHRGLAHADEPTSDPVVTMLRSGPPDEVALRERRLREALTHFDAATIATTHQFCQLVLRGLGIAGDTDPRARLVEDLTDLRDEVVDDLYLRGFAATEGPPAFSRADAGAIAQVVTDHPHSELTPAELPHGSTSARKLRFAHLVREEMARRKRRLGVLSFDDLLSELADALADESSPARQRMRDRWQVVLVDEFQDTDPVQWQVLQRAFAGHSALVLIGDPKQAIYGFRGGDVHTYLTAAATATRQHTLLRNYRSDPALVTALTRMMRGAELGSPEIAVHAVEPDRTSSRLALTDGTQDDPLLAPVRLRAVPTRLVADEDGKTPIGRVRPVVAKDCAAEVARLLGAGLTFEGRPLRAGDIAVLAHRRDSLDQVRGALGEIGIPSVIVSSESIYETPAASDWLTLLEAMAQSHRPERVRAAALTPFVGRRAADLETEGDTVVDDTARVLRSWSEVLERRGVAAVLAAATSAGLERRVLRHDGGERRLTDLRHLGEVLHERAVVEGDGLTALTTWLRERIQDARHEERTRRLESDAEAVALATIHASKGLQYPIVLLPFVADRHVMRGNKLTHLHLHDEQGRRCLDVGITDDADRGERVTRHLAEEDGEALRLLYVALTRAQSQVVAWWFPSGLNTAPSALHRMLFGRGPGGGHLPPRVDVPSDHEAATRLRAWHDEGALSLEVVDGADPSLVAVSTAAPDLAARGWSRQIDTGWLRTSYTRLTRPLELGHTGTTGLVGSEPEHGPREGEDVTEGGIETGIPGPTAEAAVAPAASAALPSPMASLPVGATFGNLVHAVLEDADPQAPDLRAELLGHIDVQVGRWAVAGLDREALADALVAVCDTPLGPLLPGATLRTVGRGDRLCEMAFELPLAGGDAAHDGDGALLGELADLLREHLPEGDPVRGLADTLDEPAVGEQPLRGYLTGSVDVVMRHEGRYVVVDYKTNWLGAADEPLTTDHYGPMALHEAMGHSSYPLQALLYAVVLHRFLRWRLPGYDPEQHLGGVLYLYVRGMAGPESPVTGGHPSGVFSWLPPVPLVEAVSRLLEGRSS